MRMAPGRLFGTVRAPASKSETHRALLLAAQAERGCVVANSLRADDTAATLRGLRAAGAVARVEGDTVHFEPTPLLPPSRPMDCAGSATSLRLLAATFARQPATSVFTGDATLLRRPHHDLAAALVQLGATCADPGGSLVVRGPIHAGSATLPPRTSSQHASALLLSLPFLDDDSTVHLGTPILSEPYLEVTRQMASAAGLHFTRDGAEFTVPGGQRSRATHLEVRGDWSSAAFLLAAAAVTQGHVTLEGLDAASAQADRDILAHLAAFGATVGPGPTVAGAPLTSPGLIDVSGCPDLFPVLAVVAAGSRGTTRFVGGTALRAKESDRIEAMAEGLRAMGISATPAPDGLVVVGGRLRGGRVACRQDHRIHMAFAVAALAADGPTVLEEGGSDASYPGFHADLARLAAREVPA